MGVRLKQVQNAGHEPGHAEGPPPEGDSLYIMLSHWTVPLSSKPLKNVEGSSAIESKNDSK